MRYLRAGVFRSLSTENIKFCKLGSSRRMETLAQGEASYTAVSLNVSNSRAYTHTTDENSKRKMALWKLRHR